MTYKYLILTHPDGKVVMDYDLIEGIAAISGDYLVNLIPDNDPEPTYQEVDGELFYLPYEI